jgi:hypothetical protein
MLVGIASYECTFISLDVVPVDPTTVDQWEHPPFSGYFDGKFFFCSRPK